MPKSRAPNPEVEPNVKRVVMCSGKVWYDLHAEREKRGLDKAGEVALVRVEQLAPFPFDLVTREMKRYPNAEVVWCQEEPMNMGAYFHVTPRLQTCMNSIGRPLPADGRIKYAGRAPSASTSTGYNAVHIQEQAQLVDQALDLSF